MLALSVERLNPRGGERKARENPGVAAFGIPGAQFQGSYLKGVSCTDRGGSLETSVTRKRTGKMPSPLKENTHFFFFFFF